MGWRKGDLLQWSRRTRDRCEQGFRGLAVGGESSSPAGLGGVSGGAMVS